MIIKKLIPLVVLLLLSQLCVAQLSGPSSLTVGEAGTYTFNNGVVYTSYTWGTGSGYTVVAPSRSGSTYSITLQWNTAGTFTVAFLDNNYQVVASMSVTASGTSCTPANPSGTLTVSPTCDTKTITCSPTGGSVPSGATWYWQTSSSGIATTNSNLTYTTSTSGTYYVRAKSSTKNCWSSGTISVSTGTIPVSPAPPTAPTIKVNNACGAKILTHVANTNYYWQGTTSNGTDATTTTAITQDFSAVVNGTNTYYLGTKNASNCWSYSSITVNVDNPPAPTVTPSITYCEWDVMNLTATTYQSNLNWYNSSNQWLYKGVTYTPTNLDVGTYTYNVKNLSAANCESATSSTITLTVSSNCDSKLNWTETNTYGINPDGSEKIVSSAKAYSDGFGHILQSQYKDYVTNQVFAAQNIYDNSGNQTLSTLAAPINASAFGYRDRFVINTSGQKFSAADFDTGQKVSFPSGQGNTVPGTLGWYYSASNNLEPLTATTIYPFARTLPDMNPDPKTTILESPGDQYNIGSTHVSRTDKSVFVKSELTHYFSLRHFFVANDIPVSVTSATNLIPNADAASLTGYTGTSGSSLSLVTQNGETYIKVSTSTASAPVGILSIGGNISVSPGETYTFRAKGYSVTGLPVSLAVKNGGADIIPSRTLMPYGGPNEDWIESTFIIPSGCTSINVGVICSVTVTAGDVFYLNAVSLNLVSNNETMNYGYKLITTDQDQKKTISFTDADGLTLATAIITSVSPLTYDYWNYNYYNDLGQLVASVAPNGVIIGNYNYPNFVTTYAYDHLGRLIEQISPDEGKSQFVYNTAGQIRFTQNAQQRFVDPNTKPYQTFAYSNYDFYGRLVESGEYTVRDVNSFVFETDKVSPANYQTKSIMKIVDLDLVRGQDIESMSGYTGISGKIDTTRCSDYVFIKYDNQGSGFPDAATTTQNNILNHIAKTENKNAATWYSYDEFGRIVKTWQMINKMAAVKTVDYTYDYYGNMTKVAYQQNDSNEKYFHFYTYDDDQRLSAAYSNVTGNAPTPADLRATYKYYLHGPLKRLELGNVAQGIDYVYNIDGSLKAINHVDNAKDPGNDGNDIFGETLQYFSSDYQGASYSAGIQNGLTSYPGSYSGLPQSISWHSGMDNQQMNAYAYQYDNRNQLSNATFGSVTTGTNNTYQFNASSTQAFQEAIPLGYDKNGNIQSLQRRGKSGNSIGNFTYNYNSNNNGLTSISDPNLPLNVNYTYNNIGQMTQQSETGGKSMNISYNAYGLVKDVKNASGQYMQKYFYDDLGELAVKIDYNAGAEKLATYYLRDVSGNVLAIYTRKNATGSPVLLELPIYGGSRLGEFRPKDGVGGTYYYEVNDHIGNVRGVVAVPVAQPAPSFANFETATNTSVDNYTNRSNFDLVDHTDAGTVYTYSQHLTGATNSQIGVTKSLKVSPGDKIKVEVYAKYLAPGSSGGNLASIASALTGAFNLSANSVGEPLLAYNAVNSYGATLATGNGRANTTSNPKAFATILLFDNNYNFVDASWRQVNDSASQPDAIKRAHQRISWEITVSQPGHAYIFLSNENPTQTDVYFDDFTLTHTQSSIIAGADYYPFGLVMEGREITDTKYRWGYQGQYAEKDSTSGWNEFKLRMYDARFGRWLSIDPHGEFPSPYLGMGNIPNMATDPDGGCTFCGVYMAMSYAADQIALELNKVVLAEVAVTATLDGSRAGIVPAIVRSSEDALIHLGADNKLYYFDNSSSGNRVYQLDENKNWHLYRDEAYNARAYLHDVTVLTDEYAFWFSFVAELPLGGMASAGLSTGARTVVRSAARGGAEVATEAVAKRGTSLTKLLESMGSNTQKAKEFFGWGNGTKILRPLQSFSQKELIQNGWTKQQLVKLARAYNDQIVKAQLKGAANPAALVRRDQAMALARMFFK